MTPDELARLRVPLSALPGFDPVGLTLHARDGTGAGLATGEMLDFGRVVLARYAVIETYAIADLDLDAGDPSTADRLARWVAGRVGLEAGCTAAAWSNHHGYRWMLWGAGDAPLVFADPGDTGEVVSHHVEGIPCAGDDRRLPDGALYVDRLALALVATHIGGAA